MSILIKLEFQSVGCRRHSLAAIVAVASPSSSPVILHFTMRRLIRTPYTAGSIRARSLHVIIGGASGGRVPEADGDEVLRERAISARLLSAQCRCNEMITGVVDAFGISWISTEHERAPLVSHATATGPTPKIPHPRGASRAAVGTRFPCVSI